MGETVVLYTDWEHWWVAPFPTWKLCMAHACLPLRPMNCQAGFLGTRDSFSTIASLQRIWTATRNDLQASEPGLRTHLLFKAAFGQSVKTAGKDQASACLYNAVNGSYRLLALNGIMAFTCTRQFERFHKLRPPLHLSCSSLSGELGLSILREFGITYLHFTTALLCKSSSIYIWVCGLTKGEESLMHVNLRLVFFLSRFHKLLASNLAQTIWDLHLILKLSLVWASKNCREIKTSERNA